MFEKKALTIASQIGQLQQRGLIIKDEDNAGHYLSHISYYRLGEYCSLCRLIKKPIFLSQTAGFPM